MTQEEFESYPLLGKGVFAEVRMFDEQTVIKRSSELDGFRLLANLNQDQQSHYRLPKIREEEEYGDYFFVERLYRVDSDRIESMKGLWEDFNDFFIIPENVTSELLELLNKALELKDYFATDESYPRFELDVRENNIMVNCKGQLTLSDPFGYMDI